MFRLQTRTLLTVVTISAALFGAPSESHAIFHNWFGHRRCCNTPVTTYRPIAVASPCNTCVPYTASYTPVTYYSPVVTRMPAVSYRPVASYGACSTCPTTVMRPVTSYYWPQFTTVARPSVCPTPCATCPTACATCPTTTTVTYASTVPSVPSSSCCVGSAQSTFSSSPAPAATNETPPPALPTQQETNRPTQQESPTPANGDGLGINSPTNASEPTPSVDNSSTGILFRAPNPASTDRATQRPSRTSNIRQAVHITPVSDQPTQAQLDAEGWRPASR